VIRGFVEKSVLVLSWTLTVALGGVILVFVGYLLIKGLPTLGSELIFGQVAPVKALLGHERVFEGIFNAIIGTLSLVAGSTVLAVPIGVSAGIYLAEYAKPTTKRLLGFFFDLLAGIPSIVIGLFGFSIALFLHKQFSDKWGPCLLTLFEARKSLWKTCRHAPVKQRLHWVRQNSRTSLMYWFRGRCRASFQASSSPSEDVPKTRPS
jgi:ABC-type phosphate transport system permease subunit